MLEINGLRKLKCLNRPFPNCFKSHDSDAKCTDFVMKIIFHSYANKTTFDMNENSFHNKNCALSFAVILRFKAARKCLITPHYQQGV